MKIFNKPLRTYFFLVSFVLFSSYNAQVNHTVNTVGNTFSPASITISVGDTVTWINGGGFHNVNATLTTYPNNPEGFGNNVASGWTFHHVFTIAGLYNYQCDPHVGMNMVGTVNVQANNPMLGTWKLADVPSAFGVGPNQGDIGWWSSSIGDLTARDCFFDDSIQFDANGNFIHYMDGNTWVEAWQDGNGAGCRAPVTPHAGGLFTYAYTGNTLTVNGLGAHIGLPKGTNSGEISSPSNAATSIDYIMSFSSDGDTMTADLNYGSGWWRTIYQRTSLTSSQPSSYNVTLSVNTSLITVGANGMYAGGGVLGDAMAVPLTDPDGDGTYTGVATFPSSGGHYVFLNSPSNTTDWGAKENLGGLPCGDPNSWNDRLMPPISSDTTILACYGSCESDGTCPSLGNPFFVTYNVDVRDYILGGATVAPNGFRIAGNFGGLGALNAGQPMSDWNPTDPASAMSDPDGDSIWSITVEYNSGTPGLQQFYKFVNGDWGGDESVSDSICGGGGGFGTDRIFSMPNSDTTLCYKWGTCNSCGSQPAQNILSLVGIIDFDLPSAGATGKAIHVKVNQGVSDLSVCGIGVANNGGGSDGQEYTFPAISVSSGDHILVCRDSNAMASYFDSCLVNFNVVIQEVSSSSTYAISQNGDDAIELFENGVVVETFGDINVDGTGEPWEYTDSWAFKDMNGNWIYGGPNCTDGSTLTATSSCPYPICTPAPPPAMVNVTFSLNTATIAGNIDSTGMFIAGGADFGSPGDNPMIDQGNGIWTITFSKPVGYTGDYTFTNGDSGWGAKENISGLPCAVPPWDDRNLPPVYTDTVVLCCFGTCDNDGTCNSAMATVNVTFQVDMSQVVDPFTLPELNGTFNNWCGNCNTMSDVNSDNVWDLTIPLNEGALVEYKFSADSWAVQEMNDPGAPCTNGDSTYTNRVLSVPLSDTILDVVCWASCDPCITPPSGISELLNDLLIYPNPASNIINLKSSEIISTVEIVDLVGRVVIKENVNSSNVELNVRDLNNEIYFIRCVINGSFITSKIVIGH